MADALDSIPAPSRTLPYRDARGRFAKRPEAVEPAADIQVAVDAALSGISASVDRLAADAIIAVLARLSGRPVHRRGVAAADTSMPGGLLDEIARQGTAGKFGGGHAHR